VNQTSNTLDEDGTTQCNILHHSNLLNFIILGRVETQGCLPVEDELTPLPLDCYDLAPPALVMSADDTHWSVIGLAAYSIAILHRGVLLGTARWAELCVKSLLVAPLLVLWECTSTGCPGKMADAFGLGTTGNVLCDPKDRLHRR
jgi:hypothetical protein